MYLFHFSCSSPLPSFAGIFPASSELKSTRNKSDAPTFAKHRSSCVENPGLGLGKSMFNFLLCHSFAVWYWISYLVQSVYASGTHLWNSWYLLSSKEHSVGWSKVLIIPRSKVLSKYRPFTKEWDSMILVGHFQLRIFPVINAWFHTALVLWWSELFVSTERLFENNKLLSHLNKHRISFCFPNHYFYLVWTCWRTSCCVCFWRCIIPALSSSVCVLWQCHSWPGDLQWDVLRAHLQWGFNRDSLKMYCFQ